MGKALQRLRDAPLVAQLALDDQAFLVE